MVRLIIYFPTAVLFSNRNFVTFYSRSSVFAPGNIIFAVAVTPGLGTRGDWFDFYTFLHFTRACLLIREISGYQKESTLPLQLKYIQFCPNRLLKGDVRKYLKKYKSIKIFNYTHTVTNPCYFSHIICSYSD